MQPGEQLAEGRFTLEKQITRSGMAEVWLARQQVGGGMSKSVVIKMIHPDLNGQQEARQRFFDEARFMSQIHHPHVVQFYDFGEEGDTLLFQVMEYIEGFAIEQIIARSKELAVPVPIPIVCRLIADACKGLGYIHELKDARGYNMDLVHRDISPQNLLIARSGTLKIIDFGIVKAREKSSRTRTGVIVGKLQYMSPEQLSSEDLDHRSDIYSVALVLYELLTTEPRFRGSNLLEVFYEALNEPPPAVVDLRPDCPQELVQVLHTALAQDKDHRYHTAYHMQEALESLLHRQGGHVGDRQVANFLSDLFEGNLEISTEHTTQIHAASLLGGFDDDVADSTVAALASSILHGGEGDGFEEEGTFRSNPGYVNDILQGHNGGGRNAPEHTFSSPSGHTLSQPYQSPASSFSGLEDIGDHTLGARPTLDRSMDEPTTIQSSPMAQVDMQQPPAPAYDASFLTPPPPASPAMPPIPSPPPGPGGQRNEQTVMVSSDLVAEAGGEVMTFNARQASAGQLASTPSNSAKAAAPRKAPSHLGRSGQSQLILGLSKQAWLIIGLGLAAFFLGIIMVVFLVSGS